MRFSGVLLSGSIIGLWVNSAIGAPTEFPYQAAVVVDEVLVRSGGGEKSFYPTQRLIRDAVVTVHRHDPGGWYVIEPPEGSFSWISATHVDRVRDVQGIVSEDDAVVFVGSEFGDEASVWQRRLGRGDTVQILEERDLETLSGPRKMFRIAPPKREWRWIPGSAVVAIEAQQRKKLDQNPFDVPSSVRVREELSERSSAASRDRETFHPAPSERLARIQTIRGEQRRLAEIDRRFGDMLREHMSDFSLGSGQHRSGLFRSSKIGDSPTHCRTHRSALSGHRTVPRTPCGTQRFRTADERNRTTRCGTCGRPTG